MAVSKSVASLANASRFGVVSLEYPYAPTWSAPQAID